MGTYYTIVQYCPDPVREERINIGAVVYGDQGVRCRFLSNWQRVRNFGAEDLSYFQILAEELKSADRQTVEKMIDRWTESIQLTQPGASTRTDMDAVLQETFHRYLIDPPVYQKRHRNHGEVADAIRMEVTAAFIRRLGRFGQRLVRKSFDLAGRRDTYTFDFAIVNGHPIRAAQSVSFELPKPKQVAKDVNATSWLVEEVIGNVPVTVFVAPPPAQSDQSREDQFASAVTRFEQMGAQVVRETEAPHWADELANETGNAHSLA